METLNCRPLNNSFMNGGSAIEAGLEPEMKRAVDVNFKRNLLTMKSEEVDSSETDDEMNGDILCGNDIDEEDEDDDEGDDDVEQNDETEDDSDEYGECYDGPYQFLSDDYDECDFTPQELQDFLYQQQQHQTMYSLRRYSLLETIQEETSDELRMNSVSEESASCRSDYSGVWCWGDDYLDDGTESVVTRPPQVRELENPVFDSDVEGAGDIAEDEEEEEEEENPLSDREGSWLDLDDRSDQPEAISENGKVELEQEIAQVRNDLYERGESVEKVRSVSETNLANGAESAGVKNLFNKTADMSWSDAIDAYLMSRASIGEKVGAKSGTESSKLSGGDLHFESYLAGTTGQNDLTSKDSATSFCEDGKLGLRVTSDVLAGGGTRLLGAKSTPDLSKRDVTDDAYTSSLSSYALDDVTHKTVSNFSFLKMGDVISWNDDVNKSQSLPCVCLDRADHPTHQATVHSVSESQVGPSLVSHLDRTDNLLNNKLDDVSLFIYEHNHSESSEEEEEDDEFASDDSGEHSNLFRNHSQPLLPFLRFTRPATLRSFRSFDTLHLTGEEEMGQTEEDEFDEVEEEEEEEIEAQEKINGNPLLTSSRMNSKSCEELSEDSGCCDTAGTLSKMINSLQRTPEDCEDDEVEDEGDMVTENEREILNGNDDQVDQLPLSCRLRNASENESPGAGDFYEEKNNVNGESNEVKTNTLPIVSNELMNNGRVDAKVEVQDNEQIFFEQSFQRLFSDQAQMEESVDTQIDDASFNVSQILSVESEEDEIMNEEEIDMLRVERHSNSFSGGWILLRLSSGGENSVSMDEKLYSYDETEKNVNENEIPREECTDNRSIRELVEANEHKFINNGVETIHNIEIPAPSCIKIDRENEEISFGFSSAEEVVIGTAFMNGTSNHVDIKDSIVEEKMEKVEENESAAMVICNGESEKSKYEINKSSNEELATNNRAIETNNETDTCAEQSILEGKMKAEEKEKEKEKEKTNNKKKKEGKRSWWFLPKSKQSDSTASSSTVPSGKNKKEKEKSTPNDVCHTKSPSPTSNFERIAGKNEELKEDELRLETRLDIDTFTNSLWVEFEKELKGTWSTVTEPSVTEMNKDVEMNNSGREKLDLYNEIDSVNNSFDKSAGGEREESLKIVNEKVEENSEVNEPTVIFDKFRRMAKEGRDRAAKSIQDLNDVEESFTQRNNSENEAKTSTPDVFDDDEEDENAWCSASIWNQFRENNFNLENAEEMKKMEEEDGDDDNSKGWYQSNQSLVGYLETDIDTFHSREVIRVIPYNDGSKANLSLKGEPSNFGSNVKRYRPVKLKTQSMFNLIDAELDSNSEGKKSKLNHAVDIIDEDGSNGSGYRAKSMEFLLKDENKAAVEAPENRLMRLRTANNKSEEKTEKKPLSEHEERFRRSLKNLNLPEWYINSRVNQNGSNEHLKRDSEQRRSLRWENFRNRSTSSIHFGSGDDDSCNNNQNSLVISKRVSAPDWRNVKSSQESLVMSPSSPANSSSQLDKTEEPFSHSYYSQNLSRWSSSRLSTTSSRCSSPNSGFNSSSSYKSPMKNQPYLGWRSAEKLAALSEKAENQNDKQLPSFYRSAAERLSKGPGYYALRFGVYNCNNSANGSQSDLSLV